MEGGKIKSWNGGSWGRKGTFIGNHGSTSRTTILFGGATVTNATIVDVDDLISNDSVVSSSADEQRTSCNNNFDLCSNVDGNVLGNSENDRCSNVDVDNLGNSSNIDDFYSIVDNFGKISNTGGDNFDFDGGDNGGSDGDGDSGDGGGRR